jgi:hypothetical protein
MKPSTRTNARIIKGTAPEPNNKIEPAIVRGRCDSTVEKMFAPRGFLSDHTLYQFKIRLLPLYLRGAQQ